MRNLNNLRVIMRCRKKFRVNMKNIFIYNRVKYIIIKLFLVYFLLKLNINFIDVQLNL